jgi:hypothetical protein
VTKIGELGTTQAATSNRRTLRRNTVRRNTKYFFNSVYLRANVTAQWPIAKLARVCRNREVFKKENTRYDSLYNDNKITFPRKIKLVLKCEKNKVNYKTK